MIIKRQEVGATKSFNLVNLRPKQGQASESKTFTQEANLVFLPRTFNITALIGTDKYGVCLEGVPKSIVILRFADARQAALFNHTVSREVDAEMSCAVTEEWLAERIEFIDAA